MQTKKLKYLLLFAVIAIAAAVAWYFAYWVKTPQYSLGLIGSAVQKHDFAAFEKHVDTETLYSSAYDDVVVASFGNERLSSPILAALVQNIKGVAVPILIDQTRQYVNGGTMEEADPSDADSSMLQNNGTDIVNNLKNKTGVNSMQYQGVEKIQKNGSIAVVTIKVFDSELGKHFLVELAMQQLADDTWQITKINNLKTLINERDQALQNKLAELNAPVQKQIDDAVAVAPQKIFITSAPYSGVIRLLEADIQLTNNAVKELQYFTGVLELYNADNELFYSGNFASSKDLAAKQAAVYKFNWELNPFLTDDAKVMNSDFSKVTWKASLSSLSFADGSTIELLTQLLLKQQLNKNLKAVTPIQQRYGFFITTDSRLSLCCGSKHRHLAKFRRQMPASTDPIFQKSLPAHNHQGQPLLHES